MKNTAYLYAHRPPNSPCWFLSAYEFAVYWKIEAVRVPSTTVEADAAEKETDGQFHATLTDSGRQKSKLLRRICIKSQIYCQVRIMW